MGIAEKIRQIWNAKIAIRNAIRAKGVTVADNEPMAGYANKISQIQSGGGSGNSGYKIQYAISSGQLTNIQQIELPSITRIGDRAFAGIQCVEYIFSEGIQEVGLNAFSGNSRLLELNLPNSLNIIGQDAFSNNQGLTSLRVGFGSNPNNLILGVGAFSNCRFIKNIQIGSRIQSLRYRCFQGLDRLETISIPSSVTLLDAECLMNCPLLTEVSSTSVTEVGSYSFSGCTNLLTVYLPNCISIQTRAFDRCTRLLNVTLNDNIINLHSDLFVACNAIKSIVMPRNAEVCVNRLVYSCAEIRHIEFGDKFRLISSSPLVLGAPKLRAVVFKNPTPPTLTLSSHTQFDQVDKAQLKVYVPDESVAAYKARFFIDQNLIFPMSEFVMPSLT